MKKNLLIFIIILLSLSLLNKGCGGNSNLDTTLTQGDIGIATTKTEYAYGKEVKFYVQNNTTSEITIPNDCPSEYLDVFEYKTNEWIQLSAKHDEIDCTNVTDIKIAAGEKTTLSYSKWTYTLFAEIGKYQIRYTDSNGITYSSNEFSITEPGFLTNIWREAFYKPLYNGLIFIVGVMPGHSLALAIILLTLIIRTILLIPSQHAIKSQKKLQDIQPKLEEIKHKYAGNQEKIAMETMRVWQENKVNPFGSCLPLLVQFPILIALFYTIKDGLNPDKILLLYGFQKDFSISLINTNFLWHFDLTKTDLYFFPIAVGLLQFVQMKLSMARKAKKQTKEVTKKDDKKDLASDMEQANKMMIYMMPLMIAFFTASVPTGVGLYWGISTTYGIVQQMVANRAPAAKDEPTVRVIEK
ncbi:MAG: YidC/Oxa1 family membrane protein insertase [Candidatus Gracilibacteria bacterium]|jgi:YidC/Oxa1 family membrane protein insertase